VLQADLRPGQRVLDIGCGTGSLAVLVKQLFPEVEVVGVDPDVKALARAARKAGRAVVTVQLDRGFSDALDYPDESFDRVFSSFMFHHLDLDEKARTLREVQRVLKGDGRLHLLDFGGPDAAGVRGLHSHRRLVDNDERRVLNLMMDAGFANATKTGQRTVLRFLRMVYYQPGKRLSHRARPGLVPVDSESARALLNLEP
jgi:ubiquinone/menaquinone biosynthesis C-methylase UbiE